MNNWTSWEALMGQDAGTTETGAGDAAAPTTAPTGESAPASEGAKTNTSTGLKTDAPGAPASNAPGQGQEAPGMGGLLMPLILIVGMVMVFSFFGSRGRKKQQAQHQELYTSLKRNDRIMLITGKYVTVDKVEEDRITVFADADKKVREMYHKNAVSKKEGGDAMNSPDATSPTIEAN